MATALLSLFHTNAEAITNEDKPMEFLNDKDFESSIDKMRMSIYKNVAKLSPNGEIRYIAGHRSHLSHRSGGGGGGGHYSHASHMSSYGGGSSHSSHSSSTYRSNSGSRYSTVSSTPKKTIATYSLGDRTLKSGLYGADVTELSNLLVKKKYIRSSWLKQKSGYTLYDPTIVSAVKRFQKDAGLTQDGNVDATTSARLSSWNESKTTMMLGVRDLSVGMSGKDVDELIALLRKAGYAPDPDKLKFENNNAIFTEDVKIAVKMFQAYNKLTPNGEVDTITLTKLKAVAS